MGAESKFWAMPDVEPKRSYRFLLEINGIESWTVKRVKRPDFSMSEISHEYINHKFWYPGRVDWSPINVTLVDPISPDNTGTLLGIIMGSGYRLPISTTPTMTPNKKAAVDTLGSVTLYGLGSGGVADGTEHEAGNGVTLHDTAAYVERWELHNPWIKSVEFGDYSYSDDSIIDLSMTIRYDFAKYQVMNGTEVAIFRDRTSSGTPQLNAIMDNGNKFIAGG